MTIKETLELIAQLRAENKQENEILIQYYQKKIDEVLNEAFTKIDNELLNK
jgi:hypothetical protein